MAMHRLSARFVGTAKQPRMYCDGRGLYLCVTNAGARSWVLRYMLAGRAREMGLGSAVDVTLADARQKAADARKLKAAGIDPLDRKNEQAATARTVQAKLVTFEQAAAAYVADQRSGWRSAKHATQWKQSLEDYAYPLIGTLSVAKIDTGLVTKILQPLWTEKTVTASRLRGRIESVLAWATVHGHRTGDNPARWRGHLEALLPAPSKVAKKTRFAAMPYADVPGLVAELAARQDDVAARALEFTILTAARTGEVLGATWPEIDFAAATWTVPGSRMKSGKEHRGPLSDRALEILREMRPASSGRIFKGLHPRSLAKALGPDRGTVHGFRSSFRDWAAERTAIPREIPEMALAHAVGSEVERSYQRSDLIEKRRRLMEMWGTFCTTPDAPDASKVVAIR
jgi:integrase